jgi:hypothetical protein
MGFLRRLWAVLVGDSTGEVRDVDGIYLYAKCGHCGAPIRMRVDKRHDLQRDYDTGEFVLHKEMMDGTCFTLLHATVRFNATYRVIEQHIEGGEFISWDDYRTLTHASPPPADA